MSEATALAVRDNSLLPAMTMNEAVHRYNDLVQFTQSIMKVDKDFGVIPGTPKPTLLKPGAEKLCSFFGLALDYQLTDSVKDWQAGFFHFEYKAVLSRRGELVATGIGSCNSKEKKYRYRRADVKCPACSKSTIIKGKAEYGGGYICFTKKGGCGAKFSDNDKAITSQAQGMVENTEPYDLVNTIQKMAQKRAMVAAVLVACNASEFFTQDVEDMELIGGWDEPAPAPAPQPHQQARRVERDVQDAEFTPADPNVVTDEQLRAAALAFKKNNNLPHAAVVKVITEKGKAGSIAQVPAENRKALMAALSVELSPEQRAALIGTPAEVAA